MILSYGAAGGFERVNIDQAIAMRINYDISGSESRIFSDDIAKMADYQETSFRRH